MSNIKDISATSPLVGRGHASSYLEWGAISGGAVLSAAISTIMGAFGAAIGLSLVSAEPARSSSITVVAIVAGLWALWIGVSSSAAGGYLAGRMRRPVPDATPHEREVRDGSHGLVVWAVGALLVTMLTTSTLLGAGRAAVQGVASATSGVASLVSQQADPLASAVDGMLRSSTANNAQTNGSTDRDSISRIFVSSLANNKLEPTDRDYLASQLAARSGIAKPEAEKRVDEAYAKLSQAKETAKQAAERARKMAVLTAFLTAAVLLVSAAAAWFGATLGGKHRDEEIDLSHVIGRRT